MRDWIASAPDWFEVPPDPAFRREHESVTVLDPGESAAIALAIAVYADLAQMDDREGVSVARRAGLAVTGAIGILDMAARRGLIDLAQSFERLNRAHFCYRQGLLDAILPEYTKGKE